MSRLRPLVIRKCGRIYINRKYIMSFIVFFSIPILYMQLTIPVHYEFKNSKISQACIIPKPNPWDSSILKYVKELPPIVCDTSPGIVFLDDNGTVQFNLTALHLLGLDSSNILCQYKILERHLYDEQVTFTTAVTFTPPFQIDSEFFHVTCKTKQQKQVFDEQFASVRRARDSSRFKAESREHLSMLLFGIDSVSRSQSIRKLPKTVQYLKEQLKAYDFRGYMKVGENSLPNILPILTGRRAWSTELPFTDYHANSFDGLPFIWKNFSARGYATLHAEDLPDMATLNYAAKGLRDPPTDHYMHPFWQGLYIVDMVNSHLKPVFQLLEDKNLHLQPTATQCYGRKLKHVLQIDYLKHFFRQYKGLRKFGFSFLNEICHDYQNTLGYGDEDFMSFFKWLKSEGHLENTVLVLFSDHGARIEKIRNTYVGRIEDRMPMLYVAFPEHIRNSFPQLEKSLTANTDRLVTGFDLYQTMMDVVLQNFKNPSKLYVDESLRAISLFQPVPSQRSCGEAWIPEDYCACYASTPVNITQNKHIVAVAQTILDSLNAKLSKAPVCEQLSLSKIHDAEQISLGLQHTGTSNPGISLFQFFQPENKDKTRYLVVIETVPGYGWFEGTADINTDTGAVTLVGDIIRVNRFGKQGRCVKEKLMQPLCQCKVQEK